MSSPNRLNADVCNSWNTADNGAEVTWQTVCEACVVSDTRQNVQFPYLAAWFPYQAIVNHV